MLQKEGLEREILIISSSKSVKSKLFLYERRLKLLQQKEKRTFWAVFCANKDKRTFENIVLQHICDKFQVFFKPFLFATDFDIYIFLEFSEEKQFLAFLHKLSRFKNTKKNVC